MLNTHEISHMKNLSGLLAGGLALGAHTVAGVPPEVAEMLEAARDQMRHLPEVIDNLNRAMANFATVSGALGRMIELAGEAGREITPAEREALQSEFVDMAKVVAADAGRLVYGGPSINLRTVGDALAAKKILGYLVPVMENTRQEMLEQKGLIEEAIAETMGFLREVAEGYPQARGAAALRDVIDAAGRAPVAVRH